MTASEPSKTSNESKPQRKTILVCGISGAGKSRFIKTATGADLTLGHSIDSDTSKITCHNTSVSLPDLGNCEFELVDTPGFQDTRHTDEAEVFHTITTWCHERHVAKRPITGLIYLKSIQEARVLHHETTLMQMLKKCWGEDRMDHILFITNRWQQPAEPEEEDRERQIVNDSKRFGSLVSGAKPVMLARLDGKCAQADTHRVLGLFLNVEPATMKIQEEMGSGTNAAETAAGQVIYGSLQQQLKDLNKELERERANTKELKLQLAKVKEQLEKLKNSGFRSFVTPVPAKPASKGIFAGVFSWFGY